MAGGKINLGQPVKVIGTLEATGLATAFDGLLISGPLSSSVDALSFNDGAVDVGLRAYAVKSVSILDVVLDATSAARFTSNEVNVFVPLTVDASLTVTNGATFDTAGTLTVSIPVALSDASTYASGASSTYSSGATLTLATGSTFSCATTATFSNKVVSTYVTSPANLTSSQNNWNPAGFGSNVPTNIRVSANAGLSLTGIIAGTSGQRATIYNVGSNALSLAHQSASSTAANRFFCPGGAAFSIAANGAVDMWYDGTSAGWRIVSK
jgi:hypothetical protein